MAPTDKISYGFSHNPRGLRYNVKPPVLGLPVIALMSGFVGTIFAAHIYITYTTVPGSPVKPLPARPGDKIHT